MLGTDGGVIQSGRDGMSKRDLSGVVLQNVGESPLQHAGSAALERKARGMLAEFFSASTGFHADELYLLLWNEFIEHADSVRPAANAGDHSRWKLAFGFQDLFFRFARDHSVEVAHHGGVRMRSQNASQQIMRRSDV